MKFPFSVFVLLLLGAVRPAAVSAQTAEPVRIEPRASGSGWDLRRAGEPFQIKGAGGSQALELLAKSGGNSIRTWGVDDDTAGLLDRARAAGLTVTLGIWIGQVRQGFNYQSYDQAVAQENAVREAVTRFKDHPALLMWGLGNEMESPADNENPALWGQLEHLARIIKELDREHPVMTVVAEIGGRKVEAIHRFCPSIDVIGINAYGGAQSVPERYGKAGGTKPYVLTEYGPPGFWEIPAGPAGASPEPTSTAKADFYRKAYDAVARDPRCLGSYAFLWGSKQEATSTWFGMLLPTGERLAAADVLKEAWSGLAPENRVPRITSLNVTGGVVAAPGAELRAMLAVDDPEEDPIQVRWVLAEDPLSYPQGGDFQAKPPEFPEAILESSRDGARIRLPESGGVYRLFAYAKDNAGGAAVANVALRVNGPRSAKPGMATTLPMVIYDEPGGSANYVPSGYMGRSDAIAMNEGWTGDPHTGAHCLRVEYGTGGEWGGVVWQHPANDWGDQPGGFDLAGAKSLSFWARGASGGEKVKFACGLIGPDKPFSDTARLEMEVTLGTDWKRYQFDLSGQDLSRIKSGFAWTLAGQGKPVVFFLDGIVVE